MVASLARPGGMMTGLSYQAVELNVKRLQILKEALPGVTRVGVLVQKDHPLRDRMVDEVKAAAAPLRLVLQFSEVAISDPPALLDAGFETLAKDRAEAVLVLQGALFFRERARLAALGLKYRLPAIFDLRAYADAGS